MNSLKRKFVSFAIAASSMAASGCDCSPNLPVQVYEHKTVSNDKGGQTSTLDVNLAGGFLTAVFCSLAFAGVVTVKKYIGSKKDKKTSNDSPSP